MELLINNALNVQGKIIKIENALKGNEYFYPGCKELLILRDGSNKRKHFAHNKNTTCTNESILHKLTKLIIVESINDFIQNGISPNIIRYCSVCSKEHIQLLPKKVTGSKLECKTKSGFIVDVGIMSNDEIIAGIEIKVTHEVDENKNKNIDIPFIELEGKTIIENSSKWIPIKDNFKRYVCIECRNYETKLNDYFKLCDKISKKYGIEYKYNQYVVGLKNCWKCNREIILVDTKSLSSSHIKPKSVIKNQNDDEEDNEYVNICPSCKTIQNNFHIYSDLPFVGIGINENRTEIDIKIDQLIVIKDYYKYNQ
jgi:hypothetical protein